MTAGEESGAQMRSVNFTESSTVYGWFWDMMRSLSPAERSDVLTYCTGGTASAPVGGFGALCPPFKIMVTRVGPDTTKDEPSEAELAADGIRWHFRASTCFNLLRIPRFASAAQMRLSWQRSLSFCRAGAAMAENMRVRHA